MELTLEVQQLVVYFAGTFAVVAAINATAIMFAANIKHTFAKLPVND